MKKALIFGGNWKASMTPSKCREYIDVFARGLNGQRGKVRKKIENTGTRIIISPPSICLSQVRGMLEDREIADVVDLAVQDPWIKAGAYTGATTFEMAADRLIDTRYSIIGHSETREPYRIMQKVFRAFEEELNEKGWRRVNRYHIMANLLIEEAKLTEDKPRAFRIAMDVLTGKMVKRSLAFGIDPILCVGETMEERELGLHESVVASQVLQGVDRIFPEQVEESLIIAYEPVWAIGTGQVATPEHAQGMHKFIKKVLNKKLGPKDHKVPVIYGGSMDPKNVAGLVKQEDIHGGLIGGASLDPDTFLGLILNGIQAVKKGSK